MTSCLGGGAEIAKKELCLQAAVPTLVLLQPRLILIQKAIATGVPPGIANQLTVAPNDHNTRSRDHLQRPRARTNAGKRRLCFSGSQSYNRLPPELHQLSLGRFKARLRGVLLDVCTVYL